MTSSQLSIPEKLSIPELSKLFKEKKLSPVEHTKEAFSNIEKLNPEIRGFVQLAEESAMDAAKEAEKKLHGWNHKKSLTRNYSRFKRRHLYQRFTSYHGNRAIL